jgi:hypothetical protein
MCKFNYLFDACVSHRNTLSGMAFARYNHYYFHHGETCGAIHSRNLVGAYIHLVYRFGFGGFKTNLRHIHKDNNGVWTIDFWRSHALYTAGAFFNEECYEGFFGTNHRYDICDDGNDIRYMNRSWTDWSWLSQSHDDYDDYED